jgi:hypothetical protein
MRKNSENCLRREGREMNRRTFFKLLTATAASMALAPTLCADTSKGSVAILPPRKPYAITDTFQMMLDNYAKHFGSYPAHDSCNWVLCKVMADNIDDTNAAIRDCTSVTPEALLRHAVIARNKRAVIEGALRRRTIV